MKTLAMISLAVSLAVPATLAAAAMQQGAKAAVKDVWKPAATPKGGIPWSVLEATKETTRTNKDGYIVSKPIFTPQVKGLAGKRVTVAGYMMPLDKGARQKHFVLLAYPPGCPFHFHATPNQFIEINAGTPFALNETKVHVVSGTLQLTGYDESGIYYKLNGATPG